MLDLNSKFGRFAKKHLKSEFFIWLTTIDFNNAPQPRPVWFIWDNDSILIYSQPKAYKVKHIQSHPNVSLHFNTADVNGDRRVIVFSGEATIDHDYPPAYKVRAYMRKYKQGIADLNATPQQFSKEYSVPIRITPTNVRGWE